MDDWFELKRISKNVFVIREKLNSLDGRFLTEYTNLYVVVGKHSAILFDTGSGFRKIKPVVESIIGDRSLIVINSHHHFDHVGGNNEFNTTHIHQFDLKYLMKPIDVSFFQTSDYQISDHYAKLDFNLSSSDVHQVLNGEECFNLGDIQVRVITTPGHTQGSICLLTSTGDLFTGDTVHYGSVYLPRDDQYQNYKHSLERLINVSKEEKVKAIYPSHEEYNLPISVITDLYEALVAIDWNDVIDQSHYDNFLDSWKITRGRFTFVFPESYQF